MWKKLLDHLYDVSICAFSFIDIFCDVFVTIQFYTKGHTIFFWISVFILLLAQISYSVLVCFMLEPKVSKQTRLSCTVQEIENIRTRKWFVLFITVLPFGQLVPLYLMISNAFPQQFDAIYKRMGFINLLSDVKKNLFYVKEDHDYDDCDPLSLYIRHKLMSHLGFVIEALIEAIPQSILQMVFLIMYSSNTESVSIINVISIIMSMIVVTSKGTILSYSIYRSAAVFNFLCFSLDIFGIFCVVSWLFCASPYNKDMDNLFEYNLYGYHMWSSSYYYFMILIQVLKCVFVGSISALCLAFHNSYQRYWNQPWRQWIEIGLVSIFWILVFLPIAVICLMVRFTLLPLLVLKVFDHSQNKSFQFYNTLFTFLTASSSIAEMHEKLLLSNWICAEIMCKRINLRKYARYHDIHQRYSETQSISLSFIYSKLGCPMLTKYHQIIEVLSLLCSRKGLWAFLFVKVMLVIGLNSYMIKPWYHILRCMYVPLDMNDISFLWDNDGKLNTKQKEKFTKLETVFYQTIADIQYIINWKQFTQKVEEMMDSFLSTDLKAVCRMFKRELELKWNRFRNEYTYDYMKSQIIGCVTWFFVDGLYTCVKQDIVNLYNTIYRKRYSNSNLICRYYKNRQLSEWNLPRCWKSYSILFGSEGRRQTAWRSNAFWNEYKYEDDNPWIGRGICIFIVVVCYRCIHSPIRWFIGGRLFEFVASCICVICGICSVLLLLILALYSVLLPMLFLFQHCYHYGVNVEQNTLQIILTLFYFVILSGIVGLFSRVWKFVYCEIHLFRFFDDGEATPQKYADIVIRTYNAAPIRNKIVLERFGTDIGGLLLLFLPKWQVLNDDDIQRKIKLE